MQHEQRVSNLRIVANPVVWPQCQPLRSLFAPPFSLLPFPGPNSPQPHSHSIGLHASSIFFPSLPKPHEETSSEFLEAKNEEDKLPELLVNPEFDQSRAENEDWVSTLRKMKPSEEIHSPRYLPSLEKVRNHEPRDLFELELERVQIHEPRDPKHMASNGFEYNLEVGSVSESHSTCRFGVFRDLRTKTMGVTESEQRT
ncbi:hypothetical protein TEA_006943 [Camellia sinensis var. sinensis]|uniref:Uncharacterized protein n=1 Tax=Camellia sinensis var. sinensis TaxID=542762 RepID=A0A4S4DKZ8_CAMSN|nr:hypothetical protein TEA_006943 [Camellia sinensis var. sinensis]